MGGTKKRQRIGLIAASTLVALGLIISSAPVLAIVPPSIKVTPSTFGSGASVTVTGTGFIAGRTVLVWLDFYSSGNYAIGEPSTTIKASSTGTFSATLNVGDVPVGSYSVDAAYAPPAFPTSLASTPVSVVDTSTLGAISSALATLSTDISNLKSDLDSSVLSLQTHIDGSISAATSTITGGLASLGTAISNLQSDLDSKLGAFNSGDSAASLLYSIQSSLSKGSTTKVSSGSGDCVVFAAFSSFGCVGEFSASFSQDSSVTLTIWLESCPYGSSCSGNQLESGGSVNVNIETGAGATNSFENVFSCSVGTCGTGIQTLTFSAGSFSITGGCGGLTNTCSDDIVVLYSYTAISPS